MIPSGPEEIMSAAPSSNPAPPLRSSPEDQPSDRIQRAAGSPSATAGATMAATDEENSSWRVSEISPGQRMLSAVTGSVLTSLLGERAMPLPSLSRLRIERLVI